MYFGFQDALNPMVADDSSSKVFIPSHMATAKRNATQRMATQSYTAAKQWSTRRQLVLLASSEKFQ